MATKPQLHSIGGPGSTTNQRLDTRVLRPLAFSRAPIAQTGGPRAKRLTESLEFLSTKLQELGDSEKERRLQNDIITAKTAFALDQKLPGGLAPEAELSYNKMLAVKGAQTFFKDFDLQHSVLSNEILARDDLDPVSRQQIHDETVNSAVERFVNSSQFTEDQLNTIQGVIETERLRLQNEFVKLNTDDVFDRKVTDAADYARTQFESLFDAASIQNRDSDEPVNLDQYFTPEFHERLQNDIRASLGAGLSRDAVDELILDQLGIMATDPENPQPDILEYLDKKRSNGKPRFSSIKGLSKKVQEYQDKALRLYNTRQKSLQKAESDEFKEKQLFAEQQGLQIASQELASKGANLDISDLSAKIHAIPNIKPSDARAITNHYKTLVTSKASSQSSNLDFELLKDDIQSGEYGSFGDIVKDPRMKALGQKHLVELVGVWGNYKQGRVEDNEQVLNMIGKELRNSYAQLIIENDPNIDISTLPFNPTTNSFVYPAWVEIKANDMKAQYRVQARRLIQQLNETPEKIETELSKLRTEMLKNLADEINSRREDPVKESVVPPTGFQDQADQVPQGPTRPTSEEAFRGSEKPQNETSGSAPTQTSSSTPGSTQGPLTSSSKISKQNRFQLDTEHDPTKHIPVPEASQFTEAARQGVTRAGKIFITARDQFNEFARQERFKDPGGPRKPQFNSLSTTSNTQKDPKQSRERVAPSLSRGDVEPQFPKEDVLGLQQFKNRSEGQKQRQEREKAFETSFNPLDAFNTEVEKQVKEEAENKVSVPEATKKGITNFFPDKKPKEVLDSDLATVLSKVEDRSFADKKPKDEIEAKDLGDGVITIGPGITSASWKEAVKNIKDFKGPKTIKKGDKVTKEQVKQVYAEALKPALESVKKIEKDAKVKFDENARKGMASILFNVGLSKYKKPGKDKSKAYKALEDRDWAKFIEESFTGNDAFLGVSGAADPEKFKAGMKNRRSLEAFFIANGSVTVDGKTIKLSKFFDKKKDK